MGGTELFILCDSCPHKRHGIASCSSPPKDSNRSLAQALRPADHSVEPHPSAAWMLGARLAFGSRVIGRKALLAHSTPRDQPHTQPDRPLSILHSLHTAGIDP